MKRLTAVAALALVVAACGGDADEEVATLEDTTNTTVATEPADHGADAEEAFLEFAQCMRDNGVPDFPDPELDENGNFRIFGGRGGDGPGQLGDFDTLQAAFDECDSLIEGVIQNTFRRIDQTELQDNFLEFAECMRENGIDMPDPDFSQGFGPGGGGLFLEIDPNDPEFQEAAEECRGVFEGTFGPGGLFGGGGPGPGGGG